MAQKDAVFGELRQRLLGAGVPPDACRAVIALMKERMEAGVVRDARARADVPFQVQVARTFRRTALAGTTALDTSSLGTLAMLFELFVAHEEKRQVSVSSLCIASGAAPTTALRQIGQLEARGFVTRQGDEMDRRRCWVCPTPRTLDLVRSLVDDWKTVLCT